MTTNEHPPLRCLVCGKPINLRLDLARDMAAAQEEQTDNLSDIQLANYRDQTIAELSTHEHEIARMSVAPGTGMLTCNACHAIAMIKATGKIEPSVGLLEWVWRDLNASMAAMLQAHPGRGFSGDDSFDDYKAGLGMLSTLAGAYFDDDIQSFGEWLDEGPQYAEDVRRELRSIAGLPEDD